MAVVFNDADLKAGKTSNGRPISAGFYQPIQFLPREEKTDDWCKQNMDFLELEGLKQVLRKAPRLAKNANLAKGIIDKSDYMPTTNPENKDILDTLLSPADDSHLELRFFPIIPSVINALVDEFAKRSNKVMYMAKDEYSQNELLELKRSEIEKVLLSDAEQKMTEQLLASGKNPEKDKDLFQQQLSPDNLKTLPEIEDFFKKTYRSIVEEWASHQHNEDVYRFRMDELETRQFENSLTYDEEQWHFRMMDDDYEVEMWNSLFTFVFKSPEVRYTSDGWAAGTFKLLSVPEVIDTVGYLLSEEQHKSLEKVHAQTNGFYPVTGYSPDAYYDNTQSHDWNVKGPSLGMRQVTSLMGDRTADAGQLERLMHPNDNINAANYLLRVMTGYWKTQRRVGHLTKVHPNGKVTVDIVDEDYVVTDPPVYNNTLIENRNTQTLIFGEHIEWIWINQVYGGVKIGPNVPTYHGMPQDSTASGLQPMYIGINSNKIGPIKYQFKGDNNLYGCKLPVEGATFTDYNTRSVCPVDLLKPHQISYNVVNNQISDILTTELGTLIAIDPNQIPQKSLGEDWGKANLNKFYAVMKNFNLITLDRSIANTEGGASAQAPLQVLNASETDRLMTKIQLATYFKNEGLSLLGITPQRLGQPIGRQTATGVEENLNASYAQTEKYFIQHSDWLMPRVHQMRTDLAMYYLSTNPSLRLQYITSKEERVNFQINGTSILLRELNIHATSTASSRKVVEELRKLLITNNTAGGTVYELGNLLTADSLGEINSIMKEIEQKAELKQQQQYQHEMDMEKQAQDAKMQEQQLLWDHESREAEADRRKDVMVATIRAAGYSGAVDLNNNQQNDFLDNLDRINEQTHYLDNMNFKREQEGNKLATSREKTAVEREKMATQLASKNIDLGIARENKNKFDFEKKRKEDKRKKEAKKK